MAKMQVQGPCTTCGTTEARSPGTRVTGYNGTGWTSAARYGLPGVLCKRCYLRLLQREVRGTRLGAVRKSRIEVLLAENAALRAEVDRLRSGGAERIPRAAR